MKELHLEGGLLDRIVDDGLHIMVALDSSGGMDSKIIQQFLNQLADRLKSCQRYEVDVFCFDMERYSSTVVVEGEEEKLRTLDIKGGAGTKIGPVLDYFKDNQRTASRLIVFTDGFVYDPQEMVKIKDTDVHWVLIPLFSTASDDAGESFANDTLIPFGVRHYSKVY